MDGISRALTALIVAALVTVAALQLFFRAGPIPSSEEGVAAIVAGSDSGIDLVEAESTVPAPTAITISLTLDRSAGVVTYLESAGVDRDESRRWATIFQRASGTRYFLRDHPLTLYKDPETGELRGFKYDLDLRTSVTMASLGNMVLKAHAAPIQYYFKHVQVAFAVNDSFKRAAEKRGVPSPIVESLEDAFADRHDLNQLRSGSAVKVIYQEKVSRDGSYHLVDGVQAAEISFGNRTLQAYAFRDEHGRAHLYDEHGRALGPQFLRFPVNFKYISSGFSFHRYHPLLHIYRPHVGVDLAAESGTPVKAVADGRVEQAGWAGELGNSVRIEHERGMVSIYGHMQRISPEVREGSYVHMGQVIGWVGSTGLSTGPHLHFALEKQGKYVNPLTQKLGVNHQVSPRMIALFDNIKLRYNSALAKLPDLGNHFVTADARKPAISPFGDMYHVTLQHGAHSASHRYGRHYSGRSASRGRVMHTLATGDPRSGAM
ncbi:MAG TPA: M23 family metallopeptidase [Candidatus Binataceae bacterium]|nr:M23 family metallopeptidase [Candidatus Binataceae bacterium]